MFINLTIVLIIIFLLCFKKIGKLIRSKKFKKVKKFDYFNKKNLNNWMNLTKKERYDLSKEQSISYLNKRRVLLEEIRNEYKKITKGNSKK